MNHAHMTMKTPVGELALVASERGLAAILWEDDDPLRVRIETRQEDTHHPVLVETEQQLNEYFAGIRKEFSIVLDLVGTPFQQKVWQALLDIPFGQTRTYGDIAREIGRPGAARAVGAANRQNPISIICPCHRVVGSSGGLTGYAGGLAAKTLLLRLEGVRDMESDKRRAEREEGPSSMQTPVMQTTRQEVGLIRYEPDLLARNLDVIFCGLNPAASAAAAGHNFSNRTNRFWPVLHLAGFTSIRLQAQDERCLLEFGCGITSVVRRPTRRAAEVLPEEFKQVRHGFEAKVRSYAPRSVAFLGKRAFSTMIGRSDVDWGRQSTEFAGTMAWVLPNPSGLNRGFTIDELVKTYSDLRRELEVHPVQPMKRDVFSISTVCADTGQGWRAVVKSTNDPTASIPVDSSATQREGGR